MPYSVPFIFEFFLFSCEMKRDKYCHKNVLTLKVLLHSVLQHFKKSTIFPFETATLISIDRERKLNCHNSATFKKKLSKTIYSSLEFIRASGVAAKHSMCI